MTTEPIDWPSLVEMNERHAAAMRLRPCLNGWFRHPTWPTDKGIENILPTSEQPDWAGSVAVDGRQVRIRLSHINGTHLEMVTFLEEADGNRGQAECLTMTVPDMIVAVT